MIDDTPAGVVLHIKVIPRAGRTELAGTRENAILIRLAAPPVDGAANAELIAFLAQLLDVPRRDITVLAGEKNRVKRVLVRGVAVNVVRTRLLPHETK